MIGRILVSRDLGRFVRKRGFRIELTIVLIVIQIRGQVLLRQVGRITDKGFRIVAHTHESPAKERVAFAGRGRLDRHALVDLQRSIRGSLVGMERSGAIVLEPGDEGGGNLFVFLILGAKLDGVSPDLNALAFPPGHGRVNDFAVGIQVLPGRVRDILSGTHHMGILFQDLEFRARVDDGAGHVDEITGSTGSLVPLLHDPVLEVIPFRSVHGLRRIGHGAVHIEPGIRRGGAGARAGITLAVQIGISQAVLQLDTVRSGQGGDPLGIKVQLPGDPIAVVVLILIVCGTVAPLVHIVGHIHIPVVRRRYRGVVQDHGIGEHLREVLVQVPADKLVTGAPAGGKADRSAPGDTEVHFLAARAPVKAFIIGIILCTGTGIGVEEHTVLDLAPPGVDRQTAVRHGHPVEVAGVCAVLIEIPAVKDKSEGDLVLGWHVAVVISKVSAVGDVVLHHKLALIRFSQRIAVAVHIGAVQEVEGIELPGIVEVDRVDGKTTIRRESRIRCLFIETVQIKPVQVLLNISQVSSDGVI